MDLKIDKELEKVLCTVAAICGIVVIEVVALDHGINGTFLTVSIASLAALGGYKLKGIKG